MNLDLAHVRKIEAENGRLKHRVEELEGDNAVLRQMLGSIPLQVPHTEGVHLTPLERTILGRLYARQGMVISKGSIHDAIYQLEARPEEPYEKIVDVKLVALRRKLASTPWRIETVWGQGLKLTRVDSEVVACAAI